MGVIYSKQVKQQKQKTEAKPKKNTHKGGKNRAINTKSEGKLEEGSPWFQKGMRGQNAGQDG